VTRERAARRFSRRGGHHGHHNISAYHRMPAPRLMAITARRASAVVKRARFAFTMTPSCAVRTWSGNRAVLCRHRPKIPGFASPPRDGFALDGHRAEDETSSTLRTYDDMGPGATEK
jgi:hypothetical protein